MAVQVGECSLVPVFVPGEHANVPSFRFFRTNSTTTRDRNLQFRGLVSTGFFEFSPVDFSLFSRLTVQFSKEMAPKCGETCPISGQRKKHRILSRLWLSWFFRSRVFVPGEHAKKNLVLVFVPGEHPPKPPFGKPFFCEPPTIVPPIDETEIQYRPLGCLQNLVSRGRCGREIARLRRLVAVVAASFLRF